jgi:hypothetical protein
MHSLCGPHGGKRSNHTHDEQYGAQRKLLAIRFHLSLLLSWKDTLRREPKASSVVGIDYEVRMELIAQPGLRANFWVRLPCHKYSGRHRQFVRPNGSRPIQKIYGDHEV